MAGIFSRFSSSCCCRWRLHISRLLCQMVESLSVDANRQEPLHAHGLFFRSASKAWWEGSLDRSCNLSLQCFVKQCRSSASVSLSTFLFICCIDWDADSTFNRRRWDIAFVETFAIWTLTRPQIHHIALLAFAELARFNHTVAVQISFFYAAVPRSLSWSPSVRVWYYR